MRDEPKSVLENVARLERENAELKARIEQARAEEQDEVTVQTRAPGIAAARVNLVAKIAFGISFAILMAGLTLGLVLPPNPHAQIGNHVRGGSAGVCR